MIKGQLTDTDRTEIVKYRIEKAYRTYQEAVGAIKNGYVVIFLFEETYRLE